MKPFFLVLRTTLLVSTAACFACAAQAQSTAVQAADNEMPNATEGDETNSDASEGEILVTATRQSEVLSRVPISISAYTAERLDQQNVRRVDDVARMTPGLTFTRSTGVNGNNTNISIRGITSGIGSATTGIYIDETPIQSRRLGNTATNAYPLIFDLERVEVLRGPQGTLFGASSQGGAVRFITPKPDLNDYSVYGRSEVSFIDNGGSNYEAGLAVGGPIVADKLGFRASAWFRHDGGWVDRIPSLRQGVTSYSVTEEDINSQNAKALKLAFAWQPTDTLTITPSVYYQVLTLDDAAVFHDRVGISVSAPPESFIRLSDPSRQQYRVAHQIPQTNRDKFLLPALMVEIDLGALKLISNTSYFDRKLKSTGDYTYLVSQVYGSRLPFTTIANEQSTSYFTNDQKVLAQEVRLQSTGDGPLSWVVGSFYSRSKQNQWQEIITPDLNQQILNRTGGRSNIRTTYGSENLPGDVFFMTNIDSVDENLSAFAQADYELLEGLKVTAGLRVSKTKFDTDVLRDGPLAGGRSSANGTLAETPVTPKFGISYQYDPTTLLYASAAKGFRPGGAQAQLSPIACAPDFARLGITETPVTFASDTLWAYEAGTKKRFGRVLQFELSAYYIKWNNIQNNVSLQSCSGTYTGNIGSVTSKGVDLTVQLRPVENLSLITAIGYNNAIFDETVYSVPPSILRTAGSPLGCRLLQSACPESMKSHSGPIKKDMFA